MLQLAAKTGLSYPIFPFYLNIIITIFLRTALGLQKNGANGAGASRLLSSPHPPLGPLVSSDEPVVPRHCELKSLLLMEAHAVVCILWVLMNA